MAGKYKASFGCRLTKKEALVDIKEYIQVMDGCFISSVFFNFFLKLTSLSERVDMESSV